jgi:hypothetical protein
VMKCSRTAAETTPSFRKVLNQVVVQGKGQT